MSDGTNGNNHRPGFRWPSFFRGRSRRAAQDLTPFRRMATQFHYEMPRDQGNRSVLLVSPADSHLCARNSAFLAMSMGEQTGRNVLLVDGNSAGSAPGAFPRDDSARGLTDLLCDPRLHLADLVLPTSHEMVAFLPIGLAEKNTRRTSRDSVGGVIKLAEEQFDFVMIAGGSVLHDPMTLELAPHVGFVLLLAIENETRMEELDEARAALNYCKARKVGLAITTPIQGEWLTLQP